jgi:diguanylate cyclase (GGDEF)-like protein
MFELSKKQISERRRDILRKNTLISFFMYHIPIFASYVARFFDLTGLNLSHLTYVYLGICISTGIFLLIIQTKQTITKQFVARITIAQLTNWLILATAWFYIVEGIRAICLFSCLVPLMFAYRYSSKHVSFAYTVIIIADYLLMAYLGINISGQPGLFAMQLLYASIFFPMALFVMYMSQRLRQLHLQTLRQSKELIELNKKFERLSKIDGLTGLFNRRQFDVILESEWKRVSRDQQPLSIIIGDVDFFKLYNDTYGHQMGDECLKAIANAILTLVRRPADFVARYGGEEFVMVLPNTKPDGALHMAELIRNVVRNLKVAHSRSEIDDYITISLGVASTSNSDDLSASDLIDMADQALYEAKEGGRNSSVLKVSKT